MLLRDWWGRNSSGFVFLIVIITRKSKQLGKYHQFYIRAAFLQFSYNMYLVLSAEPRTGS